MELKQKIIIVGYPKSGNTWITRLTAQLLNCPVNGFLYEKHNNEIATEGLNRDSEYECFKSHHQYFELAREDIENAKIIYVIRDPRDIFLSGINYFYNYKIFDPWNFKNAQIRYLTTIINSLFKKGIGSYLMKKRMIKAVLKGNEKVHHWCRVSWESHLIPYMNKGNVLKVKYEDVLASPIIESKKILAFIGESKNLREIEKAVELQSFDFVKNKFSRDGELYKAAFLREGSSNQWKKKLSKEVNNMFLRHISEEINYLGYEKE